MRCSVSSRPPPRQATWTSRSHGFATSIIGSRPSCSVSTRPLGSTRSSIATVRTSAGSCRPSVSFNRPRRRCATWSSATVSCGRAACWRATWRPLPMRTRERWRGSMRRDVVHIDHSSLGPAVRWEQSRRAAAELMPAADRVLAIVPGFVARDGSGLQTTLGRNGSDFSAADLRRARAGGRDRHLDRRGRHPRAPIRASCRTRR